MDGKNNQNIDVFYEVINNKNEAEHVDLLSLKNDGKNIVRRNVVQVNFAHMDKY